MTPNLPLSKKNNLVVQEIDNELLIYDLTENKAFCLNQTSGLVWQFCDGINSIEKISEFVSKKLNSPVNEDFIWLALEQLKKERLLVTEVETPAHFKGVSRRQVIKNIGLGTLVALPIVASLAAPTSVFAASCGPITNGNADGGGTAAMTGFNQMCISCCGNGLGTCQAAGALMMGDVCLTDCRCSSGMCSGANMCT